LINMNARLYDPALAGSYHQIRMYKRLILHRTLTGTVMR